jgi:hypothetical protein
MFGSETGSELASRERCNRKLSDILVNAFLTDKPRVAMNEARPLLGGRYSLERPLASSDGAQRWMAIEATSGRLVVVALADPGRLSTFGRGVAHRHLVAITDVVKELEPHAFPLDVKLPVGAGFAVAEHLPGKSLRGLLEAGPLHPAKAVAWTLRLADAVQALHASGAVHGAISPRSVLAEPSARTIAPVLSQLIAPPVGPFCPPERLRGAPESASDDVWALCATLYTMLTGKAPFAGDTREALLRAMAIRPAPLVASGVAEPVLQEIIGRGLMGERRTRSTDLNELQSLLDHWEREPTRMPPPRQPPRVPPRGLGEIVAGTAFGSSRDDGVLIDDASRPDDQGAPVHEEAAMDVEPESLPPVAPVTMPHTPPDAPKVGNVPVREGAARPAVARRISFNPFERKVSVWPWVVVAALAGGGGVYVALGLGSKPEAPPPAPVAAPPPRAVAAKPAVKRNVDEVRNECVAEHFPMGAFEGAPDFAFVCDDGDFQVTAQKLYGMAHDPAPNVDEPGLDAGLKVDLAHHSARPGATAHGSNLDWYELPATAIIRKTCCPNSSPVILPELPGWCEQLQSVVRRLADDSAKSIDLGPGARNFDRAVGCLFASHVKNGYGYTQPPSATNRAVFQQFLSRAAVVSTRR